eukprot:scaffold58647_cov14-Tisochrysis_lutea.AAC.1
MSVAADLHLRAATFISTASRWPLTAYHRAASLSGLEMSVIAVCGCVSASPPAFCPLPPSL